MVELIISSLKSPFVLMSLLVLFIYPIHCIPILYSHAELPYPWVTATLHPTNNLMCSMSMHQTYLEKFIDISYMNFLFI